MSRHVKLKFSSAIQTVIKDTIANYDPPSCVEELYSNMNISGSILLDDAIKILNWVNQVKKRL